MVNIAFICGSPKTRKSMSQNLLTALSMRLVTEGAIEPTALPAEDSASAACLPGAGKDPAADDGALSDQAYPASAPWLSVAGNDPSADAGVLASRDVIILAFPLYVDGIPSQLLRYMEGLGRLQGKKLYCLINCGFMEPEHMDIAMEMIRLWCAETGMAFMGGCAFGGGGIGPNLKIGKGPGHNYGKALDQLAKNIAAERFGEIIKTRINMPKKLYIFGAHRGWKSAAKKRGLRPKELYGAPRPDA